jgi:hypothetical protein
VTGAASGQMGSGAPASAGFGKAAFQRNLFYYDARTTRPTPVTLSSFTPDPGCYTIDLHNSSGPDAFERERLSLLT